jgi:oligosaccharide repeat unit polymerase
MAISMNWIPILLFSMSAWLVLSLLKKGSDLLSPARVFGLTWSVVFGLVSLKLSRLQFDWTLTQWVYALLGPASFLLGLFIAYASNLGAVLRPISEMRTVIRTQNINGSRLFSLIIIAFVTYLIGYLVIYLVKGYVPLFTWNPAAVRTDYFVFGVGLFIHHMPIVVLFALVYHLLVPGNRTKKRVLKAMVFVTALTYLFLLQRYQFIMIAVMMFTVLYYTTRYLRLRTMLGFASLGVLMIYAVATLRAGKVIQLYLYTMSRMKYSYKYAIFTEPYMYIVMNLENFVHAVRKLENFSYGYYTFDYAFALTGLKYPIREYFGLVDTPFLFSGYNTYTLFWTLYRDFGMFGICLLPLIGGIAVGFLYYSLRMNPTIERVAFYGVIVFVMVLSFFLSPLGYLWFVYILAWMMLIFKLISVRPANDPQQAGPGDLRVGH